MTATIFLHRVFCKNLNLDLEEAKFIRVPFTPTFKIRHIRLRHAGSMSYKNRREKLPLLL